MIETLNSIDTSFFLWINQLNTPWLDPFMLFISYNKIFFILLILGISIYGLKIYKKWYLLVFFCCVLSFGLSDSISTRVFKDNIKRLRPCHNPTLSQRVHLAGQKCWGGKYGFVSSHASNSFAIAMFFWLLFRKKNKWFLLFFAYATLISYSRIYLAKHYPGDVLGGALLGIICGFFGYHAFVALRQRFEDQRG